MKPKKEKELTEKEKIFCREYALDWNAARAARAAGYSEKTARFIGCRLLTKVNISSQIKKVQDEIEKSIGVSKMRVLVELKKIAFGNPSQTHNTWIERKDFESLPEDVKACIQEIETRIQKKNIGTRSKPKIVDVELVRVKQYHKLDALDAICEILGYYSPTKIETDQVTEIRLTRAAGTTTAKIAKSEDEIEM